MTRKILSIALAVAFLQGAVALAQVEILEPAYVAVTAPKDTLNIEAVKAVKSELRNLRTVVIAIKSADFEIQFNALPITGNGCQGYAVAVLSTDRNTGMGVLRAYTSATIEGLARQVVKAAIKDFERGKK